MSAFNTSLFEYTSKFQNCQIECCVNFNQKFQRAVKGNAEAQRFVADCFYYGEGACQDLQQAHRWYTLAAENGDKIARQFLQICAQVAKLDQANAHTHN